MARTARAFVVGFALATSLASAGSCTKSFESDDDSGAGASGEGGANEQGGASGVTGGGGSSGTSGSGAGGDGTGATAGTSGEAGAGTEPTGGNGTGGTTGGAGGMAGSARGGSGGDQPEGGGGGTGTPTYRDVVLEDEPLVYWRMGIATGLTVPDETGAENTLVLQGSGHTLRARGAIRDDADTAISFDGISSYAIATNPRVFDFTERAAFTLECWARRLTGGTSYFQHLLSNVVGIPNERNGYALWLLPEPQGTDNQRTSFEYDRPGAEVALWGPVPEAEVWAHYAVAVDGSTATLYVNGTLESMESIDGGFAARTGPFAVARGANEDARYFKGDIDEVAVYAHALGLGDIVEHYGFIAR